MDSGGHGQKLGGVADNGGRWLLGRSILEQAVIFTGGARGLEMKIRKTKCPNSYLMGVKPEGSTQPKKAEARGISKAGTGARSPRQGPDGANRILLSALFLALVFAWWEFTLHLELASSFWQVWQSPGP